MFPSTIPHITLPYSTDRTFVAIGNTTWQTKNIAAVSVGERKLHFSIAEPRFQEQQPVASTNWRYLVYGLPVVGFITLGSGGNLVLGAILLAALLALIAFLRIYGHRHRFNEWMEKKTNSARAQKAWVKLNRDIPTVYTLVLDTSSGKSVALTTFDANKIEEIRSAMLRAMSSEAEASISGQLTAINMDSDKLDESYEKYCRHQMS